MVEGMDAVLNDVDKAHVPVEVESRDRQLAMGPIWYEKCVREWEAKEEDQARGKQ